MPIIGEIITAITAITKLRQQRQETHDAYEILLTTLELHLPVLRRIGTLLDQDESTALAQSRLQRVVTDAQAIMTKYQNSSFKIRSGHYNQKFAQLIRLFQAGISSLVLSATFPPEKRRLLNEHVEDQSSSSEQNSHQEVYTITTTGSESNLSEEEVMVISDLVDYKNCLEQAPEISINEDENVELSSS